MAGLRTPAAGTPAIPKCFAALGMIALGWHFKIYILFISSIHVYTSSWHVDIYIYMIPQHLASINEFSSWFVSMSSIPIEALALIGSFNPLLNEFGLSCRRIAAKVTETILWTRTVDEQVHLASLETCGVGNIRFGEFFNQSLHGLNLSCSLKTLVFGFEFNQSLQGLNLPASLHNFTFGSCFNQSFQGMS